MIIIKLQNFIAGNSFSKRKIDTVVGCIALSHIALVLLPYAKVIDGITIAFVVAESIGKVYRQGAAALTELTPPQQVIAPVISFSFIAIIVGALVNDFIGTIGDQRAIAERF